MTVDFKQIKEDHPIEQYVDSPVVKKGSARMTNCPDPNHPDNNPSCQLFDDGGFRCYSCGVHGDLFDWLELTRGWDKKEAIDRLGDLNISPLPKRSKPRKPTVELNIDPQIADKYHSQLQPSHYVEWTKQGIRSDTLRHFRIGWAGSRYAFVWSYRGIATAVKLRRSDELTPDLSPKYISLKGSHYAAPYNIDAVILVEEPPDTVLIVEDEKSVMMAYQFGYTAISIPAGGFKPKWTLWLAMTRRVCFVHDNDLAGENAAQGFRAIFPGASVIHPPRMYSPKGEFIKDLFDYGSAFGNLDFLP